MFDIGWSEMAVILVVALVVIGPKDLPRVARSVGRWSAKARSMAREFQRSLDDMAREAELDDIKKELGKVQDIGHSIRNEIDPTPDLERALRFDDTTPARPSRSPPAPSIEDASSPPPTAGTPSATPAATPPPAGTAEPPPAATDAEHTASIADAPGPVTVDKP